MARLGLDGARWLKQVALFRRQGIRVVGDKAHCRQFAQGEIVNILLKIKNSFLPTKQILIGL
ncbi:hypothetical protein CF134_20500 [Aeromonas salmonicida]|nr:hypothetical protein CF134_20500 [Aeromonas salmonicida]